MSRLMTAITILTSIVFIMSSTFFPVSLTSPVGGDRDPRQMIHQNPDGSITASFAVSDAFGVPGAGGGAFNIAETINIGPHGASVNGGQSFTSDIGGNRMSFGQSNAQNSQIGPNGFSSNGANSASNSFQNPFFQSSNANANAFSNQFRQNRPFGY